MVLGVAAQYPVMQQPGRLRAFETEDYGFDAECIVHGVAIHNSQLIARQVMVLHASCVRILVLLLHCKRSAQRLVIL